MVAWAAVLPALKAAGSWIGSNLGNVGTALGGIASIGSMFGLGSSGGTDVDASVHLMNHQMGLQKEYTEWLNKNQYSQLREGLEGAGYNPLLALDVQPSQGSVSGANAQSGTRQDLSALLTAMSTTAQINYTKALTDKTKMNVVDKLLDNFDTISEKTGLPKAEKVLKNLTSLVFDNSENTASSSNNPVNVQKFLNPMSYITKIQSTAQGVGTKLADKLKNNIKNSSLYQAHNHYFKNFTNDNYYKSMSGFKKFKDYARYMKDYYKYF